MTSGKDGIEDISLDARIKIEARLLSQRKAVGNRSRIPVVPRDGPLAISYAQNRIWFFDKILSTPGTNNIVKAERFFGPVVIEAMEYAFESTVNRHETLRSLIVVQEGVQGVVPADHHPNLKIEQLPVISSERREEFVQSLVEEMAAHPFDLSKEPPLCAILYNFGNEEFLLIYVIHHIACDEWSIRTFQTEIRTHYEAFISGITPSLPELPVQYADFAAWQNKELAKGRWENALAYWTEHLRDAPLEVALPYTVSDCPPRLRGRAISHEFRMSPNIARSLDALGRKYEATPFMTMLAVTMAFLHRATGQEDLAIMSLTAARSRPELDGLIGYFTNNMVVRTATANNPTFEQFLGAVRERVLQSIRHQELPFDVLMRKLKADHTAGPIPFGSVMFTHRKDFKSAVHTDEIRSVAVHPKKWVANLISGCQS